MGLSLWGQRVNHPALLFTKERVEAAKARVQSDTCMARCWADIRKVADAALEKNDLNRSDYLALAYLMTDDRRYADRLKSICNRSRRSGLGEARRCCRVSRCGVPIWDFHINA